MRRILFLCTFLYESYEASALTIAVVGGGSGGIFGALSAAERIAFHRTSSVADTCKDVQIKVFESTDAILRAMESNAGGGVLHDTSKKPRELLNAGYPRGRKEITSLFTKHFPPTEQQRWFEHRGVTFVTQADGSMIPNDDSGIASKNAFADALAKEAESHEITILTNSKVTSISRNEEGDKFYLSTKCTDSNGVDGVEECDVVILATGNSRIGHNIAKILGHTIIEPVRSCFGLKLKTDQLDLPGGQTYHFPHVRLSYKVKVEGQKRPRVLKSEGPVEFTVREDDSIILSGLATLSLTSIAACELKGRGCEGQILMHCCPDLFGGKVEKLYECLWQHRQDHPRELVGAKCPLVHRFTDYDSYDFETDSFRVVESAYVPPAVWEEMVIQCGATAIATWGKLSPKKVRALANVIVSFPLEFKGRHTATDGSFINAGGVALNEVDMTTLKSKVADGLYFCGQILDGDASYVTFNTMRDLAMGRMAGVHAADALVGHGEV